MSDHSNEQILRILWFVTFVSWAPFMVTDLVMIYDYSNGCSSKEVANMNLTYWMGVDGYIKMAIIAAGMFFNAVARDLPAHHKMLAVCWSTLIRMYCLFELGWLVTGAVMFWGTVWPEQYDRFSFYSCENEFGYYTWALLIIGFILVVINFIVATMLRAETRENEQGFLQQRTTEMTSK